MEGKSRFGLAVLALTAAFFLVCSTWYLARTSAPEPYRVSSVRQPTAEETAASREIPAEESHPDSLLPGEVIDVNTADAYELQRLPGIGEKRAQDIIAYREEHGPFQSAEELLEVKGIGEATLAKFREDIAVGPVQDGGTGGAQDEEDSAA